MTWLSMPITLVAPSRASNAEISGRVPASSDPNTSTRMIGAAAAPKVTPPRDGEEVLAAICPSRATLSCAVRKDRAASTRVFAAAVEMAFSGCEYVNVANPTL